MICQKHNVLIQRNLKYILYQWMNLKNRFKRCSANRIEAVLLHKPPSWRPELFCKKDVLRNFAKFTGKHLSQCLFFNKVAGLRAATLLKRRPWYRRFPVIFAKFLRTLFLTEHI